jgi:hypothetical protein
VRRRIALLWWRFSVRGALSLPPAPAAGGGGAGAGPLSFPSPVAPSPPPRPLLWRRLCERRLLGACYEWLWLRRAAGARPPTLWSGRRVRALQRFQQRR